MNDHVIDGAAVGKSLAARREGGDVMDPPLYAPVPAEGYNQLIDIAVNKDVDLDKLERLIAMQKDWEDRQAKRRFYEAMSRFQATVPEIYKSMEVDYTYNGKQTKYDFAPLSNIVRAIKGPMAEVGLSYSFRQQVDNGIITLVCKISHIDGYSEETSLPSQADSSGGKNAVQAIGSTVSYLMRYTLICALGIATAQEDDDGGAIDDRNRLVGGEPQKPTRHQDPAPYPEDRFDANLPKWRQVIELGRKSPDELIIMIETKGQLSGDQKQKIRDLAPTGAK